MSHDQNSGLIMVADSIFDCTPFNDYYLPAPRRNQGKQFAVETGTSPWRTLATFIVRQEAYKSNRKKWQP